MGGSRLQIAIAAIDAIGNGTPGMAMPVPIGSGAMMDANAGLGQGQTLPEGLEQGLDVLRRGSKGVAQQVCHDCRRRVRQGNGKGRTLVVLVVVVLVVVGRGWWHESAVQLIVSKQNVLQMSCIHDMGQRNGIDAE